MKNLIEILIKEKKILFINSIVSYFIEIDEEDVIDYILFSFNDKIIFSLSIDSSGENIIFINYDELIEKLNYSGFEYNKRVELNEKQNLKSIELKYSDIEELNFISFVFEKTIYNIEIGVDCFIIKSG